MGGVVLIQGAEDDSGKWLVFHPGRGPRDPDPFALRDELQAASLLELGHLQSLGMFELAEQDLVEVVGQHGIDVPRPLDERFRQQLGSRDALEPRESVSLGDGRHELVRPELLVSRRRVHGLEGGDDDRDVEGVRSDPVDELGDQAGTKLDLHIGEPVLEGL